MALDATLWDEPVTGINLYARELAGALGPFCAVERWGAARSGEVPRGRWSRTMWALGPLSERLRGRAPGLYHAVANFNLPLARVPGVPFVLTVHDLVPLLLPDTVSRAFRWQFQAWLTRSLTVADQVVCVSEVTRQSVLGRFDVAPEKLTVVHHGVDHVLRHRPDRVTEQWLDAQGLGETPFVLYAGSLDVRKNVQLVLDAVERLFDGGRRVTLVLAGQRWFGSNAVERRLQALRERGVDVRPLGYLADPVFYALMKRASVFVFPSRYEGFGLPPLEAMRLGVPTIVSTAGSLPEVCGDGALAVAPDDARGLADQLEALFEAPALRAQWSARALAHASAFTWAATAEATHAVYARATGDREPSER